MQDARLDEPGHLLGFGHPGVLHFLFFGDVTINDAITGV